jgi:hypothetical protein
VLEFFFISNFGTFSFLITFSIRLIFAIISFFVNILNFSEFYFFKNFDYGFNSIEISIFVSKLRFVIKFRFF